MKDLGGLPGAAGRIQRERAGPELRIEAVAGAHHGGGIAERAEGETEARAEVVLVGIHQAALGQAGASWR